MEQVKDEKNGVVRPYNEKGTTGRIWALADNISAAKNRPVIRGELIKAAKAEGIPESTVSTQYYRWRRYYGLVGLRR